MMQRTILVVALLGSLEFSPAVTRAQERRAATDDANAIIALERAALDRWIRLDPQGYLDLYAPEVTYFDPQRDKRVDGLDAMKTLLAPIKDMKSPFTDPRYDMINPRVQRHGNVALLTFNLVSYAKLPDQPERVIARWNATEVYGRIGGSWKILHSHWSFTKPEIKQ